MRHPWFCLAIMGLTTVAEAGVATLRWPDAAPGGICTGLGLQQCIEVAPAGAQLRVVRGSAPSPNYHAIPGTLTITRALHLTVDPGVDAVLPEGANIVCRPAAGQSGSCQIEGFILRRGSIIVDALNTAPGFVGIRRNRIGIPAAAQADAAIDVGVRSSSVAAPSWDVEVSHNVLASTGPVGANGIYIVNSLDNVGAMRASVSDNLVESRHPQGMRSGIVLIRSRGDAWRIERNVVRGPTDTTATSGLIVFSQVLQSSTSAVRIADNWVHAARTATGAGILVNGIDAPLTLRVVNNSVVDGAAGIEVSSITSGGQIDLHNNLVVGQRLYGLAVNLSSQATLRESRNALYANGTDTLGFQVSPSTLLSDPMIEGREFPRPRSGSLLIDAGSSGEWLAGAGSASGDVAGDPRQLGSAIDIGALEWNRHLVFQHTVSADNLTANHTWLPPQISETDLPVAVALNGGSSAAQQDQVLGLWSPEPGRLAIYHEQQLPMSVTQRFIVARLGDAFPFAFRHDSPIADVCTQVSGLNDSSVAIAMHRFEGPVGAAILASPISFLRDPVAGWRLCDERFEIIPADRRFHVVVPPENSANAWYTTALEQAGSRIPLAHRLLDGTPCALPVVGRGHDLRQSFVPFNPTPFALQHDAASGPGAPERWAVHAVGSLPSPAFPAGASFNAMLSGAQALRCRVDADLLRNGFE